MRIRRLLRTKDLSKVRCSHHVLDTCRSVDMPLSFFRTLLQGSPGHGLPSIGLIVSSILVFVFCRRRGIVGGVTVIGGRIFLHT